MTISLVCTDIDARAVVSRGMNEYEFSVIFLVYRGRVLKKS